MTLWKTEAKLDQRGRLSTCSNFPMRFESQFVAFMYKVIRRLKENLRTILQSLCKPKQNSAKFVPDIAILYIKLITRNIYWRRYFYQDGSLRCENHLQFFQLPFS